MEVRSSSPLPTRMALLLSESALIGILSLLAMMPVGRATAEEVPGLDVEISLPPNLAFEILDDGRSVIVSGSAGKIEIRASKGRVEIQKVDQGPISIRSSAGDVEIEAGRSALPIDLRTRTGNITLWVSEEASLEIELATSGEITVDFSIDLDYRYHVEPAKWGSIVLGSGSTHMQLRSRRGIIRVLQGSE